MSVVSVGTSPFVKSLDYTGSSAGCPWVLTSFASLLNSLVKLVQA